MESTFDTLTDRDLPHDEPARPLLAVYAATRLLQQLEDVQRRAVREAQFSWEEIAGSLSTSRQSAHERFARYVEE